VGGGQQKAPGANTNPPGTKRRLSGPRKPKPRLAGRMLTMHRACFVTIYPKNNMQQPIKHFNHSQERNLKRLSDARIVVNALASVIETPKSIIDVGGGQGVWCATFMESGVASVKCIDHPNTPLDDLMIPKEFYQACDISTHFPSPERVDLALCIEVAEHLPTAHSKRLVEYLTSCSDLVLFSAGIPGQAGQHHINCQPPAFWHEIFKEFGFKRYDCIRPLIIDSKAAFWLKQNLFLFSKNDLQIENVPFPVCHDDDLEIISKEVMRRYRRAWEITRIPRQIKESILRRFRHSR
jgi:hypothetical protein